MESLAQKEEIIRKLQKEVLFAQGLRKSATIEQPDFGLGPIAASFPGNAFPIGAVHELTSERNEDAAATNGFLAGVLSKLITNGGYCLWVSNRRTVFPPALKLFGIEPERIIFIDLLRQKDVLWAVEEALKCEVLSAVIGELSDISFNESRRLQLAVEKSKVTGFIHRYKPRKKDAVACVTRWSIKPISSMPDDGLPGVSFPRWRVQLLKVRNGKPGIWDIEWRNNAFRHVTTSSRITSNKLQTIKTG